MKKINNYSARYKIISEQPAQLRNQNHSNPQSFAPKSKKKQLTKETFPLVDLNNFMQNAKLRAKLRKKDFFLNKWVFQAL